jgi:hypothetical protein
MLAEWVLEAAMWLLDFALDLLSTDLFGDSNRTRAR